VIKLLLLLQSHGEMSPSDIQEQLGLKHRPTFGENYLHPALEQGYVERTIPNKPNSRLQKYSLTEKGRNRVENTK
jgi:ATP-dependent DNA helicase RecG